MHKSGLSDPRGQGTMCFYGLQHRKVGQSASCSSSGRIGTLRGQLVGRSIAWREIYVGLLC